MWFGRLFYLLEKYIQILELMKLDRDFLSTLYSRLSFIKSAVLDKAQQFSISRYIGVFGQINCFFRKSLWFLNRRGVDSMYTASLLYTNYMGSERNISKDRDFVSVRLGAQF